MTMNKLVLISAIAVSPLFALPAVAANGDVFADGYRNGQYHGAQLSVALDFGAGTPVANGWNLSLGYAEPLTRRDSGLMLPLLQAHYADHQWRSLLVSGVDVLTLNQKLAATGESRSWTPWIIAGAVGAGAVAIGVHYATIKKNPASDLSKGTGPR